MTELIIFSLSTIGLTFIICLHYIFKPLREYLKVYSPNILGKLIKCTACTGFWAGILIRLMQTGSFNIEFLIYGFIGSFVSYAAYLLLRPYIDKFD